jgi:hypothetical protein
MMADLQDPAQNISNIDSRRCRRRSPKESDNLSDSFGALPSRYIRIFVETTYNTYDYLTKMILNGNIIGPNTDLLLLRPNEIIGMPKNESSWWWTMVPYA